MKQFVITLGAVASLVSLAFLMGAFTASGAMAQGTRVPMSSNIWCALSMNNSTTLAFGNVVGGESPAVTVSIAATHDFSETYGAGSDPGSDNRGTPRNQGELDLVGAEGFLWSLTSPPSTVSLTFTGNGTTDLTYATLSYSSTSGTLTSPNGGNPSSCDGAGTVYIGGSISLDAGTGIGAYAGTVNVTAAYN